MAERKTLIVDALGTEREIQNTSPFPDKKHVIYDYKETTTFLKRARTLSKEAGIGQKEATWIPQLEHPLLPFAVVLMSDLHYGSTHCDYDLLDSHFDIVDNTPNFFLITNGDHTDSFAPVKHPSGMFENPLPPHFQAKALFQRLLELDKKGKVGAIGQGNHDLFAGDGGLDYYETFDREFQAPIFDQGGKLNIQTPGYTYRMILNHTYWGRSKINITNAAKRLIEYESGDRTGDIGWVGHTHQSSYEYFTKGGKDIVAVVSGTYKVEDPWAARNGIGDGPGFPGITLMLWPTERKIEVFKDIKIAKKTLDGFIYMQQEKERRLQFAK